MNKYWASLKAGLKEDTVYPANVLAWRVRILLRVLVIYILWDSLLWGSTGFAHYSRSQLLTYVLLTILVQTLVLSSRTIDVSAMISGGDLSNFLLKPIRFFSYFFALDLGNKGMNLVFSVLEFSLFYYFFKPPLAWSGRGLDLEFAVVAVILALFLYFYVNLALGFLTFFNPENTWAPRFLFFTVLEFLAGAFFPIDILPKSLYQVLMLTPFPYFLYFPIAVFLGKIQGLSLIFYGLCGIFWLVVFRRFSGILWRRGLRVYEAWGR